jgi:hypothetical protein
VAARGRLTAMKTNVTVTSAEEIAPAHKTANPSRMFNGASVAS